VYGPFPCRPVTKILVKTVKKLVDNDFFCNIETYIFVFYSNEPFVIFAGGVPRAAYSDKISISVIQGENNHVAFEFTSKIIDFVTIDKPSSGGQNQQNNGKQFDNPQALLVLLEEEFVAIDLLSENWPQYKLPYLYSVHSSAIICTHYCNNISMKLYNKLVNIGNAQNEEYSERVSPKIEKKNKIYIKKINHFIGMANNILNPTKF
jgi:lethal(2) giant larvae protein